MTTEFDVTNFDALRISLANAEDVRGWSRGEVKKPETINSVSYTHLLHLVLRLAHRLAERVVHLEVGAARVLEPHELGYGVDGGVEVLLREGQVGVAFRRALQPGELESGPRRVERSRPQRVERPVVLRRPACRLGGVGNDRHGAVERVESHAPPRHEVRKAARRPGAARRVGEEPQVDDGDVAGAERLGFQRGEGLDRMLEPIEGRRAAQGLSLIHIWSKSPPTTRSRFTSK